MEVEALVKLREHLESFVGSWNGEDSRFMHEGEMFSEDDVQMAEEALLHLTNLEESLEELHI